MSRDGYLPDDVSEADYDRAFPSNNCPAECPNSEDWEPKLCADCEEKIEECVCWLFDPWAYWTEPLSVHKLLWRVGNFLRQFEWTHGFMGDSTNPEKPGDCTCPSAAEIKAERAERWAEEREDR